MYPWETTLSDWVSAVPTRYPIPTRMPGYDDQQIVFKFTQSVETVVPRKLVFDDTGGTELVIITPTQQKASTGERLISEKLQGYTQQLQMLGVSGIQSNSEIREWGPPMWWNFLWRASPASIVSEALSSVTDITRSWLSGISPSDPRIIRVLIRDLYFAGIDAVARSDLEHRSLFIVLARDGERLAVTRRVDISKNNPVISINQLVDLVSDETNPIDAIDFHVIRESTNGRGESSSVISPTSRSMNRSLRLTGVRPLGLNTRSELLGRFRLNLNDLCSINGKRRCSPVTLTDNDISINLTVHMHPNAWNHISTRSNSFHPRTLLNLHDLDGQRSRVEDWLILATNSLATTDINKLQEMEEHDIIDQICNVPAVEMQGDMRAVPPPLLSLNEIAEFKQACVIGRALLLLLMLTEKRPDRQVFLAELDLRKSRVLNEVGLRLLITCDAVLMDCIDPATGRSSNDESIPILTMYTIHEKYVPASRSITIHDFLTAIQNKYPQYSITPFAEAGRNCFHTICLFTSPPDTVDHLMHDIRMQVLNELVNVAHDHFPGASLRKLHERNDWIRYSRKMSYDTVDEFLMKLECGIFFVSDIFFNISEYCLDLNIDQVALFGYCRVEFVMWYI